MVTDPGYDAQFRRGYDGPPVPPPVAKAPTSPVPGARIPVAPPENPSPSHPPVDENEPGVGGVVTDQEPESVRRRNPWLIALLAVGLVMLAIGGWLVRLYATTTALNGYSADEQLQAFFQQQLSPALLTSGFVALIAWLVLGALTVKPRS
jgi:hypothetical protein